MIARLILPSLLLVISCYFSFGAENTQEKLEIYNSAAQVLTQLEGQLQKLNDSIRYAEEILNSNMSDSMKKLFQSQLDKMEDQKESIESNIKKLTSVVDELSKDPEVGSLIEGEEAARKLKQQLDKATNLLPKVD